MRKTVSKEKIREAIWEVRMWEGHPLCKDWDVELFDRLELWENKNNE